MRRQSASEQSTLTPLQERGQELHTPRLVAAHRAKKDEARVKPRGTRNVEAPEQLLAKNVGIYVYVVPKVICPPNEACRTKYEEMITLERKLCRVVLSVELQRHSIVRMQKSIVYRGQRTSDICFRLGYLLSRGALR